MPKKAGISQIKPYLIEIGVGGGDLTSQFEYLKNKLGLEIPIQEIIKPGMSVDVAAITKGKGWQGPVKRFGIKKKSHKSRKTVREVGTIGAWNPRSVMYTVPRAGQMGFHQRTEYNKQILLVGNDQSQSVIPHEQGYNIQNRTPLEHPEKFRTTHLPTDKPISRIKPKGQRKIFKIF